MSAQTASEPFTEAGVYDKPASKARFKLGYRPSLDGLRGIAILAVLGVHTIHVVDWYILPGGSLGVDIFFVLSGFLITTLLLEEWDQTASINLKKFYLRRVLRLVPALAVLLVVIALAAPALLPETEVAQTNKAIPLAFFYLSSIAIAFYDNMALGALKHTWSLGVEEQYYLLWPVSLYIALRFNLSRQKIITFTALLSLAAIAHRALLWQGVASVPRIYYSLDTRADALLIGCILGMLVSWDFFPNSPRLSSLAHGLQVPAIAILALSLIITTVFTPFMYFGGFTIFALVVGIILARTLLSPAEELNSFLRNRFLVWTGRLSYSLYLWHYPVFKAVKQWGGPQFIKLPLAFLLAFAFAALSYYLVERPVLRLKKRLI